jgi:hypothetical protein
MDLLLLLIIVLVVLSIAGGTRPGHEAQLEIPHTHGAPTPQRYQRRLTRDWG